MAVCDANYLRLRKLLPSFGLDAQRRIGLPSGDSAAGALVELRVLEHFRYTSTLRISLCLAALGGAHYHSSHYHSSHYRPPVMLVRLYHDAATAEVISYQGRATTGFTLLLSDTMEFKPDEKEQVNQFLAEWLTLCLELGLGEPRQTAAGVA